MNHLVLPAMSYLSQILTLSERLNLQLCSNDVQVLEQDLNPLNLEQNFNYLISGDNLLSLLRISHQKKFNFCYIDPPYNTGKKFVYNDTYSKTNHIYGKNSTWMAMMLPRLFLIHSCLADDACLAISIDDNAQPYLRILLDNIFGEENFVANICVSRSKNGKGSFKNIANNHEYLVIYAKTSKYRSGGTPADINLYNLEDKYGKFRINGLFRKKGDESRKEDRPNMYFPLYYDDSGNVYTKKYNQDLKETYPIDSKGIDRRWLWGPETTNKQEWMLYASKNGIIYVKDYFSVNKLIKPRTLWEDSDFYTEKGTNEIKKIYGSKIFDTPKSLKYVESIIKIFAPENAEILDAFAGTGTTAHAVANLNLQDKGTRFITLMENNCTTNLHHPAYKAGFKKLSDITEFRLKFISEQNKLFKFLTIDN